MIGTALGFLLFLPSNFYFVLLVAITLTVSMSRSVIRIGRSVFAVAIGLSLAILMSSPGVLIGNEEAVLYVIRLLVSLIGGVSLFVLVRRGDTDFLSSFLTGIVAAAVINSVVVIATALLPELYYALKISSFSGFDKNVRFLRSPGLFRGFDTSGIFMIFAICAMPLTNRFGSGHKLLFSFVLPLLSAAVLLSSRSTIVLLILALLFITFFYSRSIPSLQRMIYAAISMAALAVFSVFAAEFIGFEIFSGSRDLFQALFGFDVNLVYSVESAAYVGQYNMESLTFLPKRNDFTPDNFFMRSWSALGFIGLAAIVFHVFYLMMASVVRHKGVFRKFSVIFVLIFFLANFKNNYMLFFPYYSILIVLYASRPTKNGTGFQFLREDS